MTSNVPVVKQVAWAYSIPQLLLLAFIAYGFYLLKFNNPAFIGALTYIALSFILKKVLAKAHREGMTLVKHQKYIEAIPCFEKSVIHFYKNKWLDNYRFLTLLSSSKLSYREMGMCNIAFCYSQTGDGLKAKAIYQQVIKEYPENGLAIVALNMINSVNKQ